jgi:hypothetical protein
MGIKLIIGLGETFELPLGAAATSEPINLILLEGGTLP